MAVRWGGRGPGHSSRWPLAGAVDTTPSLKALTGTFSLPEDADENDVAGALGNVTSGSTLSLANNAGGRVALSGSNVVRGATALDYESATSHSFTVRETLAEADNSPRDTVLSLTVTNVLDGPTLNALTLSADTIEEGSAQGTVVGTVQGTTAGSTLSLTDAAGGRFQLDAGVIEAGGTATEYASATSHNITIRETLADSPNSPRDTVLEITVEEEATGPTPLAIADFANGAYAVGGAAVAVGDMWDGAILSDWDPGTDITADVGQISGRAELKTSILDPAATPFTVVIDWDSGEPASGEAGVYLLNDPVSPSDDQGLHIIANGSQVVCFLAPEPSGPEEAIFVLEGAARAALTMTASGLAVSVNGGSVLTYEYDFSSDTFLKFQSNRFAAGSFVFKKLTFYPAQDNADLPALSAL